MADDEVTVLSDAKQLPFSDRVAHKNWKVRSEAYDDIKSCCQKVFSDEDPVLQQYGASYIHPSMSRCIAGHRGLTSAVGSLFVKGTSDTNAAALDKCLEALLTFLQKANESHAARYIHIIHVCQVCCC